MFRHAVSQVRSAVRSSYASRDSFAGRFTPTSLRYFSSSTSTYGADISEIQDAKELDALVADSQSNAIIIDFDGDTTLDNDTELNGADAGKIDSSSSSVIIGD